MNNPVNWFEIACPNLEKAKEFYGKVFKMEFQFIEVAETQMYMFNTGGPEAPGSTGALVKDKENIPSSNGTIVYFSCEDVSIEASLVEEAGGKVLFPKMDIGEFGFISQFIDLDGNRIGLHSQK